MSFRRGESRSSGDKFIKRKSTTVSIATDSVATDISNFIPAGASVLAIKVEVTTSIVYGVITDIGVDTDADRFGSSATGWTLENDGDMVVTGGSITIDRGNWFAADATLRLTALSDGPPGTFPSAGAVNVTMLYVDGAAL